MALRKIGHIEGATYNRPVYVDLELIQEAITKGIVKANLRTGPTPDVKCKTCNNNQIFCVCP